MAPRQRTMQQQAKYRVSPSTVQLGKFAFPQQDFLFFSDPPTPSPISLRPPFHFVFLWLICLLSRLTKVRLIEFQSG